MPISLAALPETLKLPGFSPLDSSGRRFFCATDIFEWALSLKNFQEGCQKSQTFHFELSKYCHLTLFTHCLFLRMWQPLTARHHQVFFAFFRFSHLTCACVCVCVCVRVCQNWPPFLLGFKAPGVTLWADVRTAESAGNSALGQDGPARPASRRPKKQALPENKRENFFQGEIFGLRGSF